MKEYLDRMTFYDWTVQLLRYRGIDHKYYYLARIRRGDRKTWAVCPYFKANKHAVFRNAIAMIKLKELVGKKWTKQSREYWIRKRASREYQRSQKRLLKKLKSM